ncbi:MAG: glycine cleavage system protein GcvH [Phycisphaerales bacterium]|nr:MAG: glycine cleavage system protein GcvH [Phycisphaerales bacterium]
MKVPTDRKYSETHEWFLIDDDIVTMGITQYAADELTDITYVELPEVGTTVAAGDQLGEVESVKATSEILTAVGGDVIEVNTALADHPELINDDAFEEGWIVKIRPESIEPLTALLDAKEYRLYVRNTG